MYLNEMKEELQKEIQLYISENANGQVSPLLVWDAGKENAFLNTEY